MIIYLTTSKNNTMPDFYRSFLSENGAELLENEFEELSSSDGLFICISGKDNRDVKAELNKALEYKIPVSYVIEPGGEPDEGLLFQLGLAKEIRPEAREEDLMDWLRLVKERPKEKKKKTALRFLIPAVLLVLLAVGAFFLFGGKDSEDSGNETAEEVSQETGDSGSSAESLLYLGEHPEELTVLNLSGKGLTDISFLADAENLEELDLSNNEITDINILVALKKLRKLDISGNPIADYTILDYMPDTEVTK